MVCPPGCAASSLGLVGCLGVSAGLGRAIVLGRSVSLASSAGLGRTAALGRSGSSAGLGRTAALGCSGSSAGLGRTVALGCSGSSAGLGRTVALGCSAASTRRGVGFASVSSGFDARSSSDGWAGFFFPDTQTHSLPGSPRWQSQPAAKASPRPKAIITQKTVCFLLGRVIFRNRQQSNMTTNHGKPL